MKKIRRKVIHKKGKLKGLKCAVCGNPIKEPDIVMVDGEIIKSCPYCKAELERYSIKGGANEEIESKY